MISKIESIIWKIYVDVIYIPIYKLKYKKKYDNLKIATIEETMNKILNDNSSVTRFGDGEFNWMAMSKQEKKSFQENSKELSDRLSEVIDNDKDNLLVCLPQAFLDTSEMTAFKFWEREIGRNGDNWFSKISPNKQYYNTSITRPYIDFKNKQLHINAFDKFKQTWEDKKVLIVEGQDTKFGMGNDLLKKSKSIIRIEAPNKNAFSVYDTILEVTKNTINKYKPDIVLLALGPTATILSYDIAGYNGVQSIDIGHLDIEYEWFLQKAQKRTVITGKFVNEVSKKVAKRSKYDNQLYEDQIVDKIN